MIKKFNIEGLDCANCARVLEDKINKINNVKSAKISFIMQKITIEIEDDLFDATLKEVKHVASKFEDGVKIF